MTVATDESPTRLDIACQKWIWLLKTNELMECMNILSPVDDVINVNNVNKGESVSYPQVVETLGIITYM